MTHAAITNVPAESDWLCEGCGYTLNGLPPGGNCPECGKPTRESAGELRALPLWEQDDTGGALRRLLATSAHVVFQPTQFYRSFATRGSRQQSARFAQVHWIVASILFAVAAWVHLDWFLGISRALKLGAFVPWYVMIPLALVTYLFLVATTRLAARLTTWEATYRGYRLPLNVVLRGLDYHAAHYLPVALIAAATVITYRVALGYSPLLVTWGTTYLYTLCIEVVIAALYLFKTYWIAMRNMMYASR
jgi:hypothetical protein